jgi:hypothetical protein
MKKAYAAPVVVSSDVVRETRSQAPTSTESPVTQSLTAGAVGFYL